MKKIKIKMAVIIDQKIFAGGGYQQSLNAAFSTLKLNKDLVDVVFYTLTKSNVNPSVLVIGNCLEGVNNGTCNKVPSASAVSLSLGVNKFSFGASNTLTLGNEVAF